jgi:hypothetical protein
MSEAGFALALISFFCYGSFAAGFFFLQFFGFGGKNGGFLEKYG